MIRSRDILKAKEIIAARINKTPLILAKGMGKKMDVVLYFKPEVFQKIGSFKIRGVFNKLHYLTAKEKEKGVITLSAGSHALSLAFAASKFHIFSIAVMPKTTPLNKVNAIKHYGTRVILTEGKNLFTECALIQNQYKLTMIHPFDDPLIIAGQGTIGLEILEELPEVDMVFVPIGGGGLISGIAAAMKLKKPKVKIIGVEPIGAPTMFKSIQHNKVCYLNRRETIAECLASPCAGKYTFDYAKKYVDDFVLVSDKEILEALRQIWKEIKIKVEPSGAASLAAVIFKKVKIPLGAKIVCVLSGGNIDDERFKKFFNRK